jgi:hypothetical protein
MGKNVDLTEQLYEELKKRNMLEQEEIEDQDDTDEEEETISDEDNDEDDDNEDEVESNDDFCDMVCRLLHSQTQVHILHLQTTSYSEHKALQKYYEGIDGLVDGIVESYQGKYGIIKNYKTFKIEQYKNGKKTISYFERLLDIIENNRDSVDDTYIQNQIDTVQELINSTIYKLKYLK